MRWLLLAVLTSRGGKMIIDSDAGDAASAKYECGCYQSGEEIYVTICK
jgi:hypothetical protein